MRLKLNQIFSWLQLRKALQAGADYLKKMAKGTKLVRAPTKSNTDKANCRAQNQHRESRAIKVKAGKNQDQKNGTDDDQVEK